MNLNNETQIAAACFRSCHKIITQLEKVRESIVAGYRGLVESNGHLLELTLNEAEALAWQSGFPHLLFPTLAEEKVRSLGAWHERQQSVRGNPRSAIAA